ncbi:type VII secretion protein EccB [Amycolatopsis benzoatilytica]|uniref:type VII secretion protein EccB n=1 Tax=Amycolatopsis benzoatilytica TaxID=346045 RepID=UPI00036EB537|nr:type VII secretion protein EccB [Amycolatopsis benzoatilytica]
MVQTQKDHVEAYSFLIGRMTSALVLGDASHLEVPARRAWVGLLVGLALGVLVAVGFFVYGLIAHRTGAAPAAPAVRRV